MKNSSLSMYFGALIISIAGAGAAMMIIHVAYANIPIATFTPGQAAYAPLEQSLLKPITP